MLLWFVGPSVIIVWSVFRSPAADYRLVALGSLVPLVELPIGEPRLLHSLTGAASVLVVVMLGARGQRVLQRQRLGLPIGMLLHLVLDGAWADTEAFWWPFLGTAWSTSELPELGRGAFNVVLELAGQPRAGGATAASACQSPTAALASSGPAAWDATSSREPSVLIVVRHGRTDANASGLLLGRRLDPGLDDLGRRQAAALAAVLPGPAVVVSSPLRRTTETAAAFGCPVEVDERWVEIDYGSLDGTPLRDVPADVWAAWQADSSLSPGGGESLVALGERVRAACADLVERAARTDVVVVTHVSPVKAALAWALGVGDDVSWRAYVAPGSITRIATAGGRPSLHSFNGCAHLDGL